MDGQQKQSSTHINSNILVTISINNNTTLNYTI
nr:MAG TPA: hypothetical protein [Crassvirales sp.]